MSTFASLAANLTKMDLEQATRLANELLEIFRPVCDRIEIAGSIRRQKPANIKDVELCMVPKLEPAGANLFGEPLEPINLQWQLAQSMRESGALRDRLDKNGHPAFSERFQRAIYKDTAVDIFVVLPPAQWGVKFLLATGPAEHNRRLVTPRHQGGCLPDHIEFRDGALVHRDLKPGEIFIEDRPIDTPEEEDVFRALGLRYIAPEERQ